MKISNCCGAPVKDDVKLCPICSQPCEFILEEDSNKELKSDAVVMYYGKYVEKTTPEDEHPELKASEE